MIPKGGILLQVWYLILSYKYQEVCQPIFCCLLLLFYGIARVFQLDLGGDVMHACLFVVVLSPSDMKGQIRTHRATLMAAL